MFKKASSPREIVGALLGLLILMFALLAVVMAVRAGHRVFTTGANLFASAEPWTYMAIAWILLGTAGLANALFEKDDGKRKEIIMNAAPFIGLGLGHFVGIWIVSWLPF